jgi:hypothetical protein
MSGGGDPTNAMAGASGGAQAFDYGQNAAPAAALQSQIPGQLPQWQQGLMGALTGSKQYGQNAPMIHQALAGLMDQQRPQSPQMGGQMPRPQMGAPMAFPGIAPQMAINAPFAQGGQGAPGIASLAPWMGR